MQPYPRVRPIRLYKGFHFIPLLKLPRPSLLFILLAGMYAPGELGVLRVLLTVLYQSSDQCLANRRCSINAHGGGGNKKGR